MSVLDAFLSTWSNARATFGEGVPQPGTGYDQSASLTTLKSDLDQAAPGTHWSGGAATVYGNANTEHQRVIGELMGDMAKPHPMLRLVQGDVGSGKTLVAAAAALAAMEAGYQVALMAPTELLAEQHRDNFRHWLAPLGIEVHWLAGSLGVKARRETNAALANGSARIVVGTHALFQEAVQFHRLGLTIIDEQHRFGVQQRLALREKGRFDTVNGSQVPHQLTLTATPIPRTLAMSVYGDLDTSVIDEMPPGRKPIDTLVLPESRRPQVIERINDACRPDSGRKNTQAYWVCTLIEESEELQAQAAEAGTEAVEFEGVSGETLLHGVDLDLIRVGQVLESPHEITVDDSWRTTWHGSFHTPDRLTPIMSSQSAASRCRVRARP